MCENNSTSFAYQSADAAQKIGTRQGSFLWGRKKRIKNPKKYTKKVNQYILKSFMSEIKRDIDATVLECARYMEFSTVMHNKGYSFGE